MKISDRCCDCPAFFVKCRVIYGGPECQNFHKLVEEKFTSYNSAMPKLPGINIVETHVLNIHHDCSINERSRIAGIVGEAYNYIAGQLRQ
jgi:hypothetical protein